MVKEGQKAKRMNKRQADTSKKKKKLQEEEMEKRIIKTGSNKRIMSAILVTATVCNCVQFKVLVKFIICIEENLSMAVPHSVFH